VITARAQAEFSKLSSTRGFAFRKVATAPRWHRSRFGSGVFRRVSCGSSSDRSAQGRLVVGSGDALATRRSVFFMFQARVSARRQQAHCHQSIRLGRGYVVKRVNVRKEGHPGARTGPVMHTLLCRWVRNCSKSCFVRLPDLSIPPAHINRHFGFPQMFQAFSRWDHPGRHC